MYIPNKITFGMWSRMMLKLEGGGRPPILVENLEQGVERQMELEFGVPELRQLSISDAAVRS